MNTDNEKEPIHLVTNQNLPGQSEDKDVPRLFTFVRTALLLAALMSVGFLWWTAQVIRHATDEMSVASTISSEPSLPAEGPGTQTNFNWTKGFHVTAISLDTPPVAMISGQWVTEGESITVKNANGAVTARVVAIADGVVELKYAGEHRAVRLSPLTASTPR